MSEDVKALCETCDTAPSFVWTDQHGIAQCRTCGTPYRLYHYDEKDKIVDRPPTSIVDDMYKPFLRQYWHESKRRIPSGCSFPGGQEIATPEERNLFYQWLKLNRPAMGEAKP